MKQRMGAWVLFALLALIFSCASADSARVCPIHANEVTDYSFRSTYLNRGEDIIALRRGDTLIICMDDSVLRQMHYDPLRVATTEKAYTIVQAAQIAQSMLIDSEYQRCRQEYAQTGEFEAAAYTLYSIGRYGASNSEFDLNMDLRLIGSKWIAVVRTAEPANAAVSTCFSAHQTALRMQNGVLDVEVTGCGNANLYLEPTILNDIQPDMQMQWNNLRMEVYALEEYLDAPVYIAVLCDEQGAHRSMQNVRLQIDYVWRDSLSGYADGVDAVYCCILDEREAQLLRDGTQFQLLH